MLPSLTRFRDRSAAALAAFRSYDAAASGRRWRGASEIARQTVAMTAARGPIARRARALTSNNPFAANAVDGWVSNAVGTGIVPTSAHPDPKQRAALNAAFATWGDRADADGVLDFAGLTALVARRIIVDGDVFVQMLVADDGGHPLRLRAIDAEQIDGSMHRSLPDGGKVIAGIEFDPTGRRRAFHAFEDRAELSTSVRTLRLDAANTLQIFRMETPGQARGISWFAPVLLRLRDYDEAADAQLMRQKISALMTGFITNQSGEAVAFSGEPAPDRAAIDSSLEPGTMKVLLPGEDVRFSDPADIGLEAIEFLKLTAREIAAGLGIPYEIMTGDLTGVNYSSIRAGLVEFRRRVEAVQYNILVRQFCDPIWRRFVTVAALRGNIDARAFARAPEDFFAVKWITPRQQWVDPLKDARAEIEAINAGLMSRREAVASRGWDVEQLDEEIAADHARAVSLGLAFAAPQPPIDPTEPQP